LPWAIVGAVLALVIVVLLMRKPPAPVAERIRAALQFVPADRLVVAPDCGMKYLSRAAAFGKLRALAEGAAMVRKEIG
jgi:5-methyltetrahydropteroyltriglutamate--homocysteine methyltransferase